MTGGSLGSQSFRGLLRCKVGATHRRFLSQQVAAVKVADTDVKQSSLYPPVKPRYPPGLWGRMADKNAWAWHDRGTLALKAHTLPERLAALAGTEAKGYWQVNPFLKRRHALAGVQYMTKTRVKQSLPEIYKTIITDEDGKSMNIAETLLSELCTQDVLVRQNESNVFPDAEDRDLSSRRAFLRQMITFLCSLSVKQNPAIGRCQVAEQPFVESAWQRWGFKFPDVRTTTRDEGGIRVQSSFRPEFTLRSEHPLRPVLKTVDDVLAASDADPIPEFTYTPSSLGLRSDTVKPSWLPGFNHGDPCEFGAVQIIDISHYLSGAESEQNFKNQPHIVQELMGACAVMAGFTWASALAHYQGFSMYHDVTYPFCVQTILTDSKRFAFSNYQLNTLALFKDGQSPNGNIRENTCWVTDLMPLCTPADEVPKASNVDVVKLLLSFFRYPIDAQNPPLEKRRPYFADHPSPLASTEPIIPTRTPVPPEVTVVDEFWKV